MTILPDGTCIGEACVMTKAMPSAMPCGCQARRLKSLEAGVNSLDAAVRKWLGLPPERLTAMQRQRLASIDGQAAALLAAARRLPAGGLAG